MAHFLFQRGALVPLLIVAAIVLFGVFLSVRRWLGIRKIKNKPLTSIDSFHASEPQNYPGAPGWPRLTGVGWGIAIMSFVMGIVGLGVTYATLRRFELDDRFAREAQATTAAVVHTSNAPAGNKHAQHGHIIQYQFQVSGQTYQGTADVPSLRSLRTNAQRSKEIDIRYLSSDPAINRPAEEKNLPIVIGLLPLTLFSVFFLVFARQLRRDFVLARGGRPTTGVVVGAVPYAHATSIYYDFPNDGGGVTRGNSMLPLPYSWNARLGSAVQVLYLPDDPERNILKLSSCWQA